MKVKTKIKICEAIGIAAFFYAWGTIGSIELDCICLTRGAIRVIVSMLVSFLAFYKSGAFRWRRN